MSLVTTASLPFDPSLQMLTPILKAIIIGGGPAGISAALRLQQQTSIRCTVYELRPEPPTIGGSIGIMSNGMRLLHRLGVADQLKARGSNHQNLALHSIRGHVIGEQKMVGNAQEETGHGYLRIKRTDLQDVLLGEANRSKIPIHYNKSITSIQETGGVVKVKFSDGTTDEADILLGCDGIHSAVRRLHVDPEQRPVYTGIAGLGSIVPTSTLSPSTRAAIQGMNATFTQQGMFMVTSCTASGDEIFWGFSREVPIPESGDARDGWEVRRQGEVDGFKSTILSLLQDAEGDWGVTMREVVAKTSAVGFYPVHKLPGQGTWSKGRVILLGDAAHAMPPHAGQGVSMAMEDVFLLSRLLACRDRFESVEALFGRYEDIRRPRVDEITAQAVQNGKARKSSGSWGLWLKEITLWVYFRGASALGFSHALSRSRYLLYDIDQEEI